MPLKPLLLLTNSAETGQVELLLRTELAEQHDFKNLVGFVHVFIKKGLKNPKEWWEARKLQTQYDKVILNGWTTD